MPVYPQIISWINWRKRKNKLLIRSNKLRPQLKKTNKRRMRYWRRKACTSKRVRIKIVKCNKNKKKKKLFSHHPKLLLHCPGIHSKSLRKRRSLLHNLQSRNKTYSRWIRRKDIKRYHKSPSRLTLNNINYQNLSKSKTIHLKNPRNYKTKS